MAANYVRPLINKPMDPFLMQQIEEQRRYNEGQAELKRQQGREDFQFEQGMRNEASAERLAMELEARRKAARKDLKMRRGFQLEDLETKRAYDKEDLERDRGYAEKDIERDRRYAEEDLEANREYLRGQSELMAGELPDLREKIRAKGMQLADIQNSLLVETPLAPGQGVDQEAGERTISMNEAFLARLSASGMNVTMPKDQRGSVTMSTSSFMNWLKNTAPTDLAEKYITDYRNFVNQTKQSALQDPRIQNQILSINGTLRQLQGREAQILKSVQGGGVDYSSYSGITQPRPQMYAPTPATPGQQRNALNAAMGIPNSLKPGIAPLARYESGVEDTQVGGDAFSGIEDMHSATGFGNPFSPDEGDGSNEFQKALDQTDNISDDGQAVRYLLEMRQRLNESQEGAMSGLVDRMDDAQGDSMYDDFIQYLSPSPSSDGVAMNLRNFLDASTVEDVEAMEASTKGAYATLDGYIENMLAQRDPDGTLRPQVQTILDREAAAAAQQASQQTP